MIKEKSRLTVEALGFLMVVYLLISQFCHGETWHCLDRILSDSTPLGVRLPNENMQGLAFKFLDVLYP